MDSFFRLYTLKRVRCKIPEREMHYEKYSSISAEGQLEFYCSPLRGTLTQNMLTTPITGRSHSDIYTKFSISSFKLSFLLVTHALHFSFFWMHSRCSRCSSLICVHCDQNGGNNVTSIYKLTQGNRSAIGTVIGKATQLLWRQYDRRLYIHP